MNEEAALLRAICEHPDEDTPRLVFADWLSEQGGAVNAAWANGIRAQVWLARGSTDEAIQFQTCVFDSRFGLEKLHERLELPAEIGSGWERGFPAQVAGVFREVRNVWPGLAFRIPIRKLYLHEMTAAKTAEMVRWPALTVLRELSCTGNWHRPPTSMIPALAGCANLRNLKALRLYNVVISDETVTAVLDSPHLVGLDVLQVGYEGTVLELSNAVRDRLTARFGENVLDNSIPF